MSQIGIAWIIGMGLATALVWGCGGEEGRVRSDSSPSAAGHAGMAADPETGSDGNASGGSQGAVPDGPVITSVSGDRVLSDLTPQEATQVCEETEAASREGAEERERLLCTVAALSDTAAVDNAVAACETRVTECMAAQNTEQAADCTTASQGLDGCDATVDEVNTCMTALFAFEEQFGEAITCELSDPTQLFQLGVLNLAVCFSLNERCPGFVG